MQTRNAIDNTWHNKISQSYHTKVSQLEAIRQNKSDKTFKNLEVLIFFLATVRLNRFIAYMNQHISSVWYQILSW